MRMRQLYNKGNIFHLEITKKTGSNSIVSSQQHKCEYDFFSMIFKHYNKKFNGWA